MFAIHLLFINFYFYLCFALTGVIAAGSVGLMVVIVTIVIAINVNHFCNDRKRLHHNNPSLQSTFHDIELSQFSQHMNVVVNPLEDTTVSETEFQLMIVTAIDWLKSNIVISCMK